MKKSTVPVRKSRVFIASSVEGSDIAETIQYNLRDFPADRKIWHQGFFQLTESTIDGILRAVGVFDFGIFVFSPDDTVKIRAQTHRIARDNVIFEMGVFLGRLGKRRTVIVKPRGKKLKLPSDLIGLTTAEYQHREHSPSLPERLAPVCYEIKSLIRRIGPKAKSSKQVSAERLILLDLQKKIDHLSGRVLSITSIPVVATKGKIPFRFSPKQIKNLPKI